MKIRRVDFSPDEWIAGTVGLDNAERGLYITACALIYSADGPIRFEHLRSACRDHGRAFNRQLAHLLALGKLIENGGEITNKRALNELEIARKRIENAQINGAKGGRPKGLANPEVSATGNLTINHQLPTTNYQKESDAVASGCAREEAPANGSRRRKQRRPIEDDWLPGERDREFARAEGRSDEWIDREGPRFRDFHIGKGNLFADHSAAWRTWVRNAAGFELGRNNGAGRSGGDGPPYSAIAAAVGRIRLKDRDSGFH